MISIDVQEKLRMIIIALVGSLIGWLTYEIIYYVNPLTMYRASSSWFVEFVIGVTRQHALHRWFTFKHVVPYWDSLVRAYFYYSGCAITGAGLNYILTEVLNMHHRFAWGLCLLYTALISLFFLKRIVFPVSRKVIVYEK